MQTEELLIGEIQRTIARLPGGLMDRARLNVAQQPDNTWKVSAGNVSSTHQDLLVALRNMLCYLK